MYWNLMKCLQIQTWPRSTGIKLFNKQIAMSNCTNKALSYISAERLSVSIIGY